MRGISGGGPWLLMEHATGGVELASDQPAEGAGRADPARARARRRAARTASMFFQWRAPGRGPSSSTRRCCRTPAATRGPSGRSWRSAPTWRSMSEVAGLGRRRCAGRPAARQRGGLGAAQRAEAGCPGRATPTRRARCTPPCSSGRSPTDVVPAVDPRSTATASSSSRGCYLVADENARRRDAPSPSGAGRCS